MNMFKKKRSHSLPPPDRSTAIAATAAANIAAQGHERTYSGLSSAAAAAALKHRAPTPEPPLPTSPRQRPHSRHGSGDSTGSQGATKSRMTDRSLRPHSPSPLEYREPRYAASESGLPSPPRTAGFPIDALRPAREHAPSILASVREEQSDGEGEYFEDPDEADASLTPDGYSPTSPTSRSAYYRSLRTSAAAMYARNGVNGQGSEQRRFVPVDAVAGSQPGAVVGARARGGPSAEAIALAQAMYNAQTGQVSAPPRRSFSKNQGAAAEPTPYRRSKASQQQPEAASNGPSAEAIELAKQMLLENPSGVLKSKKTKKKKKKRKDEEDEEEPKEEPNHFKDYLLKNFGQFEGDEEYGARGSRRHEGRRFSFTMASLSSGRTWSTGRSRRDSVGTDRQHFSHTDREPISPISTRHDSLVGSAVGVPNPTDAQRAQLSKRPRQIDIGRFMFEQRANLDPILDVPGSSDSKQGDPVKPEEEAPKSPESVQSQREEWEAVRARWSNLKSQQWQNVQDGVEPEPVPEPETGLNISPKQDSTEGHDEDGTGVAEPKPQPKALLAVAESADGPDDSSSVYSNHIVYDAPVGLENPEERAAKNEEAAAAVAKARLSALAADNASKQTKEPSLLPAAEIVEKKRMPLTLRGDKLVKTKQPTANGASNRAAAHNAQRSADLEPELLPESVNGQYHAEAPPLQRTNSYSSFKRKRRPNTATTATAQPVQRYSMSMPMRNSGPPQQRPTTAASTRARMTPSVAPPPRSYSPDSVRGLKALGRKNSVARFFSKFTRNSHAYVG